MYSLGDYSALYEFSAVGVADVKMSLDVLLVVSTPRHSHLPVSIMDISNGQVLMVRPFSLASASLCAAEACWCADLFCVIWGQKVRSFPGCSKQSWTLAQTVDCSSLHFT